jgi:regulator of protease activity HflC (stomatin/prohibitin superfamily)
VTEQQAPAPAAVAAATAPAPVDSEGGILAPPYVQIVESHATPIGAAEALEQPDVYGRLPVIVRIQRQPPIRVEWILIAIGLGASGLFLPLFDALRAIIIVAAIAALIVGFMSRIFIRVPPGSIGLVVKSGRDIRLLEPGVRRVTPLVALTHLVTTREIAFDVPVSEVRSSDGIAVTVDLLLTLGISDAQRVAYTISTSDLDQLVHASTQEAVRTLIRGTEALNALDLGPAEAARLRETIDAKLTPYGVEARAVAFTRVMLPSALMASLEARRLSAVQLVEEEQSFALDQRRISDRASLITQEAEARRSSIEQEAAGESIRLERLQQRIAANPEAARYDLESQRLRVAQQLAGNTRAVVSLGGASLLNDLLVAREATTDDRAAMSNGTVEPAPAATPAAAPAPNGDVAEDDGVRPIGPRRRRRATE